MISPEVRFLVELQDLARKHGLDIIEQPGNSPILYIFDPTSGFPTDKFLVRFSPKLS